MNTIIVKNGVSIRVIALLVLLMCLTPCIQGQWIMHPTDDSYNAQRQPDSNHGYSIVMSVRNLKGHQVHPPNWERNAYLKFDLSSIPPNWTVVTATLHLFYYDYSDSYPGGRDLEIFRVKEDWDESTITFNNQPPAVAMATSKSIVPEEFGWMTWNVTKDVQYYMRNSGKMYGWKIMDNKPWNDFNIPIVNFYSKEYPHYIPYLEVFFEPIGHLSSNDEQPDQHQLNQNYPNPFNPVTEIRYNLVSSELVKLRVFNVLGREVTLLVNGLQPAGIHRVSFDASALASGWYFYQLETSDQIITRKMLFQK